MAAKNAENGKSTWERGQGNPTAVHAASELLGGIENGYSRGVNGAIGGTSGRLYGLKRQRTHTRTRTETHRHDLQHCLHTVKVAVTWGNRSGHRAVGTHRGELNQGN